MKRELCVMGVLGVGMCADAGPTNGVSSLTEDVLFMMYFYFCKKVMRE